MTTKKVLNVGGNTKDIPLPDIYQHWQQVWLDIDPAVNPDVLCDARNLMSLAANSYDAIYCSHNLEHYFAHDVKKVLTGFHHVLTATGLVHIRVPDIGAVLRTFVEKNMDIHDVLYDCLAGPITVHDVIYGWCKEIERSGNDFFAHKTGFTKQSLTKALVDAGFGQVYIGAANMEISAFAFKCKPSDLLLREIGLAGKIINPVS